MKISLRNAIGLVFPATLAWGVMALIPASLASAHEPPGNVTPIPPQPPNVLEVVEKTTTKITIGGVVVAVVCNEICRTGPAGC